MEKQLLAPAAVLVLWTLFMLLWTVVTRMPALKAAGIDIRQLTGGKGTDADNVLPPQVQWKAHNYNHLMEQPTVFYATVLILAVAGGATQTSVYLAWGYAGLRIVHSIWQATVNKVSIRFTLFALSTVCLVALAIAALNATLGG